MSPVYIQKYFSGTLFVPFPTRDTRFQSDMLDIGCCFAKKIAVLIAAAVLKKRFIHISD